MASYFLRRLGHVAFILVAMSIIIFGVTQVLPGNIAYVIAGQWATPDQVAAIELRLGLNDPLITQYARWAGGALHGDFGNSLVMNRPVAPLIAEALGRSTPLALCSLLLIALIGISAGSYAAVRQGGWVDRTVLALSWFSVSVPQFLVGIVLILIFAGLLQWLPATGYSPLGDGLGKWVMHLLLPVLTLVIGLTAHVAALQRASMLEALGANYVRAARAKGLSEWTVITRHALRNTLVAAVTVLSLDLGILMGGAVVVEMIFSYPGLGRLLMFAIEQKDFPVLQAGVLTITTIYTLANLAADLAYAALDPRIRFDHDTAH